MNLADLKSKLQINTVNFERVALWSYMLGTAFTALGPVIHYTFWTVTLAALLYGKLRYGTSVFVMPCSKSSRNIFYLLLIYVLWSMFANAIYINSFYVWGKGASIPLEFLFGLCMAIRLLDTDKKRMLYGLLLVIFNAIFCFDVIPYCKIGSVICFNNSLKQGNTLGLYGVIIFPYFCCYAFWHFKKQVFVKTCLCVLVSLVILLSFSSGAWLTTFCEALIFIYFALKKNKITFKFLISGAAGILLLLFAFNYVSNNAIIGDLHREIGQDTSYTDFNKLTTNRYDIWKVTLEMSKEHPFTGWGTETFETEYKKHVSLYAKKLKLVDLSEKYEPHDMYISWLYSGGLPALMAALAAWLLAIVKAIKLARQINEESKVPWELICLMSLVGMTVFGIGGDIFAARRDIATMFWAVFGILLSFDELPKVTR